MTDKEKLISIAKAQVGNGPSRYRNWYYGNEGYGIAWCAVFVSWCFNQIGGLGKYIEKTDGAGSIPRESISAGLGGKWYESEFSDSSTTPQVGDVIVFTWNYAGRYWDQDKYYSDHVGIVYAVDNNYVYTIEGNSGSSNDTSTVRMRSYSRWSGAINGYYRPAWKKEESKSDDKKKEQTPTEEAMEFELNDCSNGVLVYKTLLRQASQLRLIKTKVGTSNIFDTATKNATIELQQKYKLDVDGIAGVQTITALQKALEEAMSQQDRRFTTMKFGDWNLGVACFKALCAIAKKLTLIDATTDEKLGFGEGTSKATKQIQQMICEKETGIATEFTIQKLKTCILNAIDNLMSTTQEAETAQ